MNRRLLATVVSVATLGALSTAIALGLPPSSVQAGSGRLASVKHTARLEAGRLLSALRVPEGAKEVSSDPAVGSLLGGDGRVHGAPPTLLDVHRFWRVPAEPQAVIPWLEANMPAGSRAGGHGETTGPRGASWEADFSFSPQKPRVIPHEDLVVETAAAEGGGTALRADAHVTWNRPRPADEQVPAGVKLISVNARASGPSDEVSVSRRISAPASVQKVIALVEDLPLQRGGKKKCPKEAPRRVRGIAPLVTELRFRESAEMPPVATLVTHEGCPQRVRFSVHGEEQPELSDGYELVPLLERLLRVELFSRGPRRPR